MVWMRGTAFRDDHPSGADLRRSVLASLDLAAADMSRLCLAWFPAHNHLPSREFPRSPAVRGASSGDYRQREAIRIGRFEESRAILRSMRFANRAYLGHRRTPTHLQGIV